VASPSPDAAEVPFLDAALMKLVNEYLAAHAEMRRLDEIINRARNAHDATLASSSSRRLCASCNEPSVNGPPDPLAR
jgi:hypothetical protein